jgi:replication-associated recombination protein RarA
VIAPLLSRVRVMALKPFTDEDLSVILKRTLNDREKGLGAFSLYEGYKKTKETIGRTGTLLVPLHIRNAPTKLMKDFAYGKGYRYAHDFPDACVAGASAGKAEGQIYYRSTDRGYEKIIRERLEKWHKLRGNYFSYSK